MCILSTTTRNKQKYEEKYERHCDFRTTSVRVYALDLITPSRGSKTLNLWVDVVVGRKAAIGERGDRLRIRSESPSLVASLSLFSGIVWPT